MWLLLGMSVKSLDSHSTFFTGHVRVVIVACWMPAWLMSRCRLFHLQSSIPRCLDASIPGLLDWHLTLLWTLLCHSYGTLASGSEFHRKYSLAKLPKHCWLFSRCYQIEWVIPQSPWLGKRIYELASSEPHKRKKELINWKIRDHTGKLQWNTLFYKIMFSAYILLGKCRKIW